MEKICHGCGKPIQVQEFNGASPDNEIIVDSIYEKENKDWKLIFWHPECLKNSARRSIEMSSAILFFIIALALIIYGIIMIST